MAIILKSFKMIAIFLLFNIQLEYKQCADVGNYSIHSFNANFAEVRVNNAQVVL